MTESAGQRLQNKVAVVTGAASGFGAGIARRFAAEGAAVVAADLSEAAGQDVVGEIAEAGGRATFVACDVTARDAVRRMVQTAVDSYGGLDVLVNNAGYSHVNQPMTRSARRTSTGSMRSTSRRSTWPRSRRCRCSAPGRRLHHQHLLDRGAAAAAGPDLVQRLQGRGEHHHQVHGGRAGARQDPGQRDLPGDRRDRHAGDLHGRPDTPENRAKFIATIPLGRMSTPDDIAAAALYPGLRRGRILTGVCLEVDGGRCV